MIASIALPASGTRAAPVAPATPADSLGRRRALAQLHAEVSACRRCVLAGYRVHGPPVLGGDPSIVRQPRRVMLIGQAPGRTETASGRPFCGQAGRRLFGWLASVGIEEDAFRRQVYMAALTRCYPGSSPTGHGDRRPSPAELALCRPFLDRALALIGPQLILLVGSMAIDAFLGKMPLVDAVGRMHVRAGQRYLPLPHPSGASTWLNDSRHQALLSRALALLAQSGLIETRR